MQKEISKARDLILKSKYNESLALLNEIREGDKLSKEQFEETEELIELIERKRKERKNKYDKEYNKTYLKKMNKKRYSLNIENYMYDDITDELSKRNMTKSDFVIYSYEKLKEKKENI